VIAALLENWKRRAIARKANDAVRFRRLSDEGAMPLFCFPCAGGGPLSYRPWLEHLPRGIALHALDLPGRGARFAEPSLTRLDDLVDAVCAVLVPLLRPGYALFGHSFGGRLAVIAADRLARAGYPAPGLLVVAGCRHPAMPVERDVAKMSEPDLIAYLKALGGTPPEALDDPEFRALVKDGLLADFRLGAQTARLSGMLDCPVLALGGEDDPEVSRDDLERFRVLGRGPFAVQMFPGGHFFVRRPEVIAHALDHVAHQNRTTSF
jgi:medium-chain acyl-[acyl-carrier-protein] hydrolase